MIKCLSRVKRAIALFSLLCLVLLPATIVCGDSRAAGEAGTTGNIMASPGTIRLDPSPATADVGEPVTTYVWLENGADYYGIDIRFRFDEDLVSIPSGHVTPLWDVFDESNQMIIKNQVDDGLIWYSITNLNPAGPFTGTGRRSRLFLWWRGCQRWTCAMQRARRETATRCSRHKATA